MATHSAKSLAILVNCHVHILYIMTSPPPLNVFSSPLVQAIAEVISVIQCPIESVEWRCLQMFFFLFFSAIHILVHTSTAGSSCRMDIVILAVASEISNSTGFVFYPLLWHNVPLV